MLSGPLLFVSTMDGYPWGGSEELWSQAAMRFHQKGVRVTASVEWWDPLPQRVAALREAGIAVWERRTDGPGLLRRVVRRIGIGRESDVEAEWVKEIAPVLVVISQGGFKDGWGWADRCRKLGIPYVLLCQCHSELWWPHDRWLDRLRETYLGAVGSFFVCQANLRLLETQLGIRLPNSQVVFNPPHPSVVGPVPWPAEEPLRMALVGRMDPVCKGQDLLASSLADPVWRERSVQVSVFGSGPCAEGLRALFAETAPGLVEFRGQAANPLDIWREHHLLLLPSRVEGSPLALIEAMRCGRPAVATDVGGIAELLQDGVTGFLAAGPVTSLWREAMERAWHERSRWSAMGVVAAQATGRLLPEDPVEEFCVRIEGLASA